MPTAVIFSVPQYIPDAQTSEVVTGYNVQSLTPSNGAPTLLGTWNTITGSPFASNLGILDVNGTVNTMYRVQPIRQVTINSTTYTLDTPWSRPFLPTQTLYDGYVTRFLLPAMRFTYLHDEGVSQSNGTNNLEVTGAGQGTWAPDGEQTRFPVQYVIDDDPVKILDYPSFNMTYLTGGTTAKTMTVDVDYTVDLRNGVVTFALPPAADDYIRFDFRRCDFVNDDLLQALNGGVNSLSHFGLNGFQFNSNYNLQVLNTAIPNPDLGEIISRVAVWNMRGGQTEAALRNTMAWRDGGASADPAPSRALEFLVQSGVEQEKQIRRQVNSLIRLTTLPIGRGEFDMQFDMTQYTPIGASMFQQLSYAGGYGVGNTSSFYSWWL